MEEEPQEPRVTQPDPWQQGAGDPWRPQASASAKAQESQKAEQSYGPTGRKQKSESNRSPNSQGATFFGRLGRNSSASKPEGFSSKDPAPTDSVEGESSYMSGQPPMSPF